MESMSRDYKLAITVLVPSPIKPEYEKDFDTLFAQLKEQFVAIVRNMDGGQGRVSIKVERIP